MCFVYPQYFNFLYLSSAEVDPHLTMRERIEAEAAPYEAAQFYHFIKGRADQGRKMVVIGNQRYGDFFVVDPLRRELEDLGVKISFNRVPSTGTSQKTVKSDLFSDAAIQNIIKDSPDIVVVDGTARSYKEYIRRFPSAMYGYLNWFLAYNAAQGKEGQKHTGQYNELQKSSAYQSLVPELQTMSPQQPYRISHWVPGYCDRVVFGDDLEMPYAEPSNAGPEVIFVNPVIDPNKNSKFPRQLSMHQPGFLDDPDYKAMQRGEEYAFTDKGIAKLYEGKTEEEFVKNIRRHMENVLPSMIRATDPQFN